ncbi:MAG: hypothetical protein M1816_003580 [Peltula sp. TS41687]|nr:MAG: hypothetical protein M1816_003580 [Peltula sp. TS41687]
MHIITEQEQLEQQIDVESDGDGHRPRKPDRSDKLAVLAAAASLSLPALHASRQMIGDTQWELTSQYQDALAGLRDDNDPELDDCVIKEVRKNRPASRDVRIMAIWLIDYCREELAKKKEKAQHPKEEDGRTEAEDQGQPAGAERDGNGIFGPVIRPFSSLISKLPKSDSNKSLSVTSPLAGALTKAATLRTLRLPP